MDDMISRRAAIDAVHKEFDECLVWDESGKYTADEVERILTNVPSAQPEQIARDISTIIENERDMRVILKNTERTETHACDCERTATHDWIPVTEALPEDGVTVWVTIRGHDVITCEGDETLEQAIDRVRKMVRVEGGFYVAYEETWYNAGGYPMMVQPVAWMPMEVPEPYKEGQK